MNDKKVVYPEWFLSEIADEATRIRFAEGGGKKSEKIMFRCSKGHPDYCQLVKNHITTKMEPRHRCPLCAKENQIKFVVPSWVIDDIAKPEDKERMSTCVCSSNEHFLFSCIKCAAVYDQRLRYHFIGKRMCPSCTRKHCGESYRKTMSERRKPYPQWFVDELVNDEDKQRALTGELSGTETVLFRCLSDENHPNYTQIVKGHICISTGAHRNGCPECRYIKSSKHRSDFYRAVRKFPDDLYDDVCKESDKELLRNCSLTYNDKIEFVCHSCGRVYKQMIKDHIRGKRCSKCAGKISDSEIELGNFIKSFYSGEVVYNSREVLGKCEVDIYIPEYKIAIEYNGSFWHRAFPQGFGSKDKLYHFNKFVDCKNKGIRLISIFDVDFCFKKTALAGYFSDLFGTRISVYARKCTVHEISYDSANALYEKFHLLGKTTNISVSYGLFFENELISCMSFQKGRYKDCNGSVWCLTRFVTKTGYTVIGGASRLLHQFENTHKPISLVSYSDNDYFTGNVYEKLGFTRMGFTKTPRYYWYLDGIEYKREQCQLKNLSKLYPDLFKEANKVVGNKEDFIMSSLGAYKVYRSGNTKWLKLYRR